MADNPGHTDPPKFPVAARPSTVEESRQDISRSMGPTAPRLKHKSTDKQRSNDG